MRRASVVIVLAGVVLGACAVGQPEFVVEIEEATALDAAADRPLELAAVTQFEWDTFHVFGPGTSAETIAAELGFPWRGGEVEGPERNGRQLVVFVRDRAVVGAAVMDRCRPDFVPADGVVSGLVPSAARFHLDERGDCWQAEVVDRARS